MARVIVILASAAIFTMLGMGAATLILLNRPPGFQDREGVITTMMVLGPTVGGLLAGTALGFFATLSLKTTPRT
jgi:ABC-type molybdate transport system permease subunit